MAHLIAEHSIYPNRRKPWRARARRYGFEIHLGYFATREEAEEVELKYEDIDPSRGHVRRGPINGC